MKKYHFLLTCLFFLTTTGGAFAQKRITLLFVGDLMQHKGQIDAARTPEGTYDYTECFDLVRNQISQADIAIGNLEVTLGGKPYTGYPAFSAPDEYLQAIQDAGFDVLLTANNHCLDRGRKGLERTLQQLDSLHIPHAGTYRNAEERKKKYPLLIHKNGFRIAILNYTYGTNGIKATSPNIVNYINRETIQQDIRQAQTYRPDAIIACMHWGEEYQTLPNREQQELTDWLLQQGVTHIIGAHPHVIQPLELRTNGLQQHVVAYSLGNFISNMLSPNTDGGMMLTLQLEKCSFSSLSNSLPTTRSYLPLPGILDIPQPYCKVRTCHYNLVWTARPSLTGKKNFFVCPIDSTRIDLPEKARKNLEIFKKRADSLLLKHNKGISSNEKKR